MRPVFARIAAVFVGLLLVAAVATWIFSRAKGRWASPLWTEQIERTPERRAQGEYLAVHVIGCFFCHAQRDFSQFSGPPIEGTLGGGGFFPAMLGVWAPNITPDPDTGVGAWSDGELVRAIRESVSRDGHMLVGMFPVLLSHLSDEEVRAIVVYLRSLPPIKGRMPPRRLDLKTWLKADLLAFPKPAGDQGHVPEVPRTDERGYGDHLGIIGGCAYCHSGYIGGNDFWGPWGFVQSPNLTPHPTGMSLDEAAFMARFRLHRPASGRATVPAPPAGARPLLPNTPMQWSLFAMLKDEDLRAIYHFLRSLPPYDNKVNVRELADPAGLRARIIGDRHDRVRWLGDELPAVVTPAE